MSPDTDQDNLEARATALLRERFRNGSRLIVVGLLLFAVADFFINPAIIGLLYAIAAGQLVVVGAGLWLLRRIETRRGVTLTALSVLAGVFGSAAYSDIISNNTQSTSLLAAPMTLVTATLLPWSVAAQAMAVVIFEAAGGIAAVVTLGSLTGYGYAVASALMIGVASVGIVAALERSRIARWRMEQELTRSTRAAEEESAIAAVLLEVSQSLATNLNRSDMLEGVNEIAVRALGCDWSSTFLWDAERRVTRMVACAGVSSEVRTELAQLDFRADRYPLVRAVRPGELIEIRDARDQPYFSEDLMRRMETASALYAPIVGCGKIVGTQIHGYRTRMGPFSERQQRLARGIANATAVAFENARLIADLRGASDLKSEFVATMSHELRTPLNVITGYADMLAEGAYGELTADQEQAIARIHRSSVELLELVTATLDLGRLETGREEVHRDVVDMAAVFAELAAELDPLRQAAVRLGWHGAGALCVLSDRVKIKTVLKNLVANALKFTPTGRVDVTARHEAEQLVLEVRDTGIGIKRDDLRMIFDMYRQVDGSSTRRFGGVGLGLHIVKRLATLLGGTIAVTSVEGEGSTFVFRHPASLVQSRVAAAS